MKFTLETGSPLLVHGYDTGSVTLTGLPRQNQELEALLNGSWDPENKLACFRKSLLLDTAGRISAWAPQSYQEQQPEQYEELVKCNSEIILLGMGSRLQFPPAECLSVLQSSGIGFEVMDTAAACRTFNVLAAEGREVLAALIMIGTDT